TPIPPSPSSRSTRYGPTRAGISLPRSLSATEGSAASRNVSGVRSSASSASTSATSAWSPSERDWRKSCCSAAGRSAAAWKSSWTRRQRSGPVGGGSACGPELMGQEGAGGAPVAEHGGLGDAEDLAGFADVEPPEEATLDDQRLARLELGERLQRSVEGEELV